MIDLHTHTTASDGRYPPRELVVRAVAAGVTMLGVTDHDTVAGCAEAAAACAAAGLGFVPGIEMTAVLDAPTSTSSAISSTRNRRRSSASSPSSAAAASIACAKSSRGWPRSGCRSM